MTAHPASAHTACRDTLFVKQEVRRGSWALRTTQGAKPDGTGSGRRARSDISRERPGIDDAARWWGSRDCQRAHRESAWVSGRLGIAFEPAPLVSRFGAASSRKRACTTATYAAFCSQCTDRNAQAGNSSVLVQPAEGDYPSLPLGNRQPPCLSSQECLTSVVKTC